MAELREMARGLGFYAIDASWPEYADAEWLKGLLEAEQKERERRGLERRLKEANIGRFKPISQFDWSWPKAIDREQVEELFSLEFLEKPENIILIGTNGLGKTMIAQNLAYQAVMSGYGTQVVKASAMLDALLQCGDGKSRKRLLGKLCRISLLLIDEVGYMSYSNQYADLLYEVISGRYQRRPTIVTTNTAFKFWGGIFPNAACVVTLVDQLVHHSEIVTIEGDSYRHHEAEEQALAKGKKRKSKAGQRKQKQQ
ncbi:MAG: ATP-binding protein [Terriglobia bacterium]